MKLITISNVGYNHPSQANWSYGIWKVDLIDTKLPYCMSHTTRENFGGNTRFAKDLRETHKIRVIETKGIFECPKITGVSKMPILDSQEFINEVVEWYKGKQFIDMQGDRLAISTLNN